MTGNAGGQFTTFKTNAADLLARALRPHQRIYCSPLVDPYQPAEANRVECRGSCELLRNHRPPSSRFKRAVPYRA